MNKKLKLIAVVMMLMFSQSAFAQTLADGIKAIENENFVTARRILLAYTKANPTDVLGFYQLGNAYCFLENNDSSRWAFTQGTTINSKHPACFVGLGKTFLNENNVGEAQKNFDLAKALVNANKDINLAVYLADAYVTSEHPNAELAIQILRAAENISIKDPRVYSLMGDAYVLLNKGGESVTAYERSGELDPTDARPYSRVGMIWNLAHNYTQSLASFEKAIGIDAKFAPAYRDLAELYFNTGQYDKAKETFQKYLELADKTDETQYRYAEFLFLTKDYSKCIEVLNELKSRNPNKVNLLRLAAYSDYETGNYSDGLKLIQEFFSKSPADKHLAMDYQYYSKMLMKTGNDSLAAENAMKAVQMDSSLFDLFGDVAQSYYTKKSFGKAAFYYDLKIKKSDKPTVQDCFSLGRSYYFDSSYALADTAFKMVGDISPTWPISYIWRARCEATFDNPDSLKGYAIPMYYLAVERILADSVAHPDFKTKYKTELKEAYRYLADYNTLKDNYEEAMKLYDKYLEIDPDNADVKKTIESIKAMKKPK